MTQEESLDRGRASFARQAWADAFEHLTVADRRAPLEPPDLELLATAAYLLGRDEDCVEAWARAHHDALAANDVVRAARYAFWLGLGLLLKGQYVRGGGWIARSRRLLQEREYDCVELGYLLLPISLRKLAEGDAAGAHAVSGEAAAVGRRFGDANLVTLGRLGQGQALVRLGRIDEGVGLLDEVMVALEAGDLAPIVIGVTYCAGIEACQESFDLRRAQAWTQALTRWCEAQPDLVPFRGQCLVRRAELLQLQGAWQHALHEARRACELLTFEAGEPAAGAAFYQSGELHRLRGEVAEAEEAYSQANRWGRKPQPGLALLRLAQGQRDAAMVAVRGALEEAQGHIDRAQVLPAFVEIMLAAGEVAEARASTDELSQIAGTLDAPLLHAMAASARGAVLLAEHDPAVAIEVLRGGLATWRALEAPYQAARVRVLLALAYRDLGDDEAVAMELDAARWAFDRLGATPDAVRVDALTVRARPPSAHGLTRRELEVLRHVAAGARNKAIAATLAISERTVERHVSNIFVKLGVSTRAAATARAHALEIV
jgi:DNA-binding NarL/FixJ family response regulator